MKIIGVVATVRGGLDRLRSMLHERRSRLDQQVLQARATLAQVDAAERLLAFLADAQRDSRYEQYRGLLGRVHRDLLTLSERMVTAHGEWAGSIGPGPPPLQRIVLYIDDLDRCPPRRVVDVLAATHLLLALPLFVVVVAVDPHWLVQSLRKVHGEWFALSDDPAATMTQSPGGARPLDYLDKIFQVPYALRPSSADTTGRYLRALVPEVANPHATSSSPDGPASGVASDPGVVDGASTLAGAGDEPTEPDRVTRDLLTDLGRSHVPATAVEHNLRRIGLRLQAVERDFLGQLGAFVPTPRAAKKLVNLYRLLRIGIPEPDLNNFVGPDGAGPYRTALLLLSIVVGYPTLARSLLADLAAAKPEGDIVDILRARATDPDTDDSAAWARLADAVSETATTTGTPTTAGDYQQWCATVARFSFETYDLVYATDATEVARTVGAPSAHRPARM
jgi:hypothetical protein